MGYVNLEPEQIHTLLKRTDVEILDLRDRYSFELGHIQGATPANDDNLRRLLKESPKDKSILIYCYHGDNSLDMAMHFFEQGYQQVFNINGGWKAVHQYMQRPGQVYNLLYGEIL